MSRKGIFSTFFLCLFVAAPALSQTLNRCVPFFTNERVAFDLTGLDTPLNGGNYSVMVLPHRNPKTGLPVLLSRIEFKACGITNKPEKCPEVQGGAFAYYWADGICYPQIMLSSLQEKEVIKVNEKVNGVSMAYNNNNLPDDIKKVTGPNLKFRVTCNKDNTENAKWSFSTEGDYLVLSTEHASGCGKALDDLLELVIMYKWIFLVVFVAIGIIFTFFGNNAYKWTLLLTGFILGFLLVAIVCYSFGLFHNSTDTTKYGILGASFLAGIVVGFILYKMEIVTIMIVCGVLTSLIFMAIMSTFFANSNMDKLVLLLLTIGVGVIGGILSGCYKE